MELLRQCLTCGCVCGGCELHPYLWGQLDGRPAIEAAHRNIFETIYRGSHARFGLRRIRFLRPDVAVVFAQCQVKFKEGNEAREIETRPTLIMVKEQDKWQIVAFQNTKISEVPAAAQAAARLATFRIESMSCMKHSTTFGSTLR